MYEVGEEEFPKDGDGLGRQIYTCPLYLPSQGEVTCELGLVGRGAVIWVRKTSLHPCRSFCRLALKMIHCNYFQSVNASLTGIDNNLTPLQT